MDKFVKTPLDSLKDAPGNIQREGSKVIEELKKINPIPIPPIRLPRIRW